MYKIRGSLFCKILAVLVFLCSALVCVGSFLGAMWMNSLNAYTASYSESLSDAMSRLGQRYSWDAGGAYLYEWENVRYEDTDFRFAIYEDDKLLFSNYKQEPVIWTGEQLRHGERVLELVSVPEQKASDVLATPAPTVTPQPTVAPSEEKPSQGFHTVQVDYRIVGYILEEDHHPGDDFSKDRRLFDLLYPFRYELIWLCIACFLLALGSFVFLLFAAGRKTGQEKVCLNVIDRLPYDLFTGGLGFLVVGGLALGMECFGFYGGGLDLLQIGVGMALFTAAGVLALLFLLSTAARLKAGGILKSCLVYKVLAWCFRPIKRAALWALEQIRALPMVRKGLVIFGLVLLVEMFFICITDDVFEMELVLWFLESAALALLLIYALVCMKKLRTGAKELAAGNEEYRIDTKIMKGDFLAHAEDLNRIGEGIGRAVEERMKSERFKTELITNVSHDIKTPLTSIINYVELLEKEEPENEKMREYLEVLSRQCAKLKKLIEDLIEASKASTGNLTVHPEDCELGVLLTQTAGEYSERLESRELELVLKKPEEPVIIRADGRHMWRIFDNLMNNIVKYAQPRTRVYLSLEQRGDKAVVIFRNISGEALNVSGEELMERFVRGDRSRSGEGSGLGLSIARSLVQLQKGEMKLTVDGDLFKVELLFPKEK